MTSSSLMPARPATWANGPLAQGERALHEVQELLVGLVERNGRAVAPGADLGARRLHARPSGPPFQPGDVLGVVGDHDVGAGAADAGQRLEHGGALVEQSALGGGLEHGVLAADVVGRDGHARGLLDAADDVQVGQRGLDHQDVGALVGVELGLAHGLERVGRIHLVALAVARLRRAVGGDAERAVEGGGVLGRVGDDRRLAQPVLVERRAQGADAAVHHVAGRDGVRARLGLRDRGAREQLERLVVVDDAVRRAARRSGRARCTRTGRGR